ncbi:hypothetical protein [Phenylobacterium sp. SCN 70-31]|uniref:hypothetical protein n=1 Tax=Phenylobacterium sp. SCN 70-31 TaxID=1660129 RepID=UPI00086C4E70|nr:hypothetical protein [Phenylobacterium sp. SCN 70-31]ODT86422.1 MAG: hypothetical protein ABS78_16580 [Phenylobacterium sp. SCN 70-31]
MNVRFTNQDLAEWSSAALVFVSGAMTGHFAAVGMTPVQMAGAAAAVLGSVAAAVAVRVWPARVGAEAEE